METLIVTIKNKNKAAFTKQLLKSFDFLDVKQQGKENTKSALSKKRKSALIQGFKELKLAEQGKLKTKSATGLLKELRNGKN